MSRHQNGRPAAMSAGISGFASFAARPRRATRGSRSAPSRHSGGACCACNRATGAVAADAALVTVAALRCAHLRIQRRPPDSVESNRLRITSSRVAASRVFVA
jgi:hypothetical protein